MTLCDFTSTKSNYPAWKWPNRDWLCEVSLLEALRLWLNSRKGLNFISESEIRRPFVWNSSIQKKSISCSIALSRVPRVPLQEVSQ